MLVRPCVISPCSLGAPIGVICAVYEDGMLIPWTGLSRCCTPSRHSGLSSLSANDPRSSEIKMSILYGIGCDTSALVAIRSDGS